MAKSGYRILLELKEYDISCYNRGDEMNEELKRNIIKSYKEYLDGELLEDSKENIELYISTLWYDLMDDIELNREMFGVNKDIDDYDAAKMIENIIKEILINR